MIHAVQISGTDEIILAGESLERIREHIRVNPTRIIVYKTREGWKPWKMWNVMCRVWGGVTGTRQALLKENGQVKTFPTRAAAEAEAARLTKQMNHPNAKAQFEYCAWEAD